MTSYNRLAAIALTGVIAVPTTAFALTGTGGCSSLPEYYRALGAMQPGMTSACDMSVAEARRILSGYGGPVSTAQDVAPAPRSAHRRARTPPS